MIQAAWKVSDSPFDPIRHDQPRNRLVHPLGVPGADAGAVEGLIFGPTGAAMSPTHTRKGNRLYRYYVSQDVLKRGPDACPVGRVPAAEIEAAVVDQLRGIFRQPEIIVGTWRAARAEQDDITEEEAREALLPPSRRKRAISVPAARSQSRAVRS